MTLAERPPDPAHGYPDAEPSLLVEGSARGLLEAPASEYISLTSRVARGPRPGSS